MNPQELRTAISLAVVFAVRMLGLFMILPVLPLYMENLGNATPLLIGLAIGIYGFTQAVFQIPLGLLSDKIGRKPVIIIGLLIFLLGSILAASTKDVQWIILGRCLQGMGAIAATTMALAADLTRERVRTRIMGFIGMSIGVSFALAMVLGPIINASFGINGIFWSTALLTIIAIALVIFVVPTPKKMISHSDAGIIQSNLMPALNNRTLLKINLGAFFLHAILTASFLAIPLIFSNELALPNTSHWKIYLPVLLGSMLVVIPMIIMAEKFRKIKILMITSTLLLLSALLILGLNHTYLLSVLLALVVFFIGFNFLEASQPSLVAKFSPLNSKGTAMGVFASFQFMGIFFGGLIGGYLMNVFSISGLFYANAIIAIIYAIVMCLLPQPNFYKTKLITLNDDSLVDIEKTNQALLALSGVNEVLISAQEKLAHIKIDKVMFEDASLDSYIDVK